MLCAAGCTVSPEHERFGGGTMRERERDGTNRSTMGKVSGHHRFVKVQQLGWPLPVVEN
eukprot:m.316750 g.316750  ORF g.316750 m.316750 type:complete len:59 (-) comp16426_c2_seq8:3141-3317(-)